MLIKRGERKHHSPPASPPVGEEEREVGEVAGREREKKRERAGRFEKWKKVTKKRGRNWSGLGSVTRKTTSFRLNETASFRHTDDSAEDSGWERHVVSSLSERRVVRRSIHTNDTSFGHMRDRQFV